MIKQFFSEEYIEDVETSELMDEICRCLNEDGKIFYKFPSIKEFDKAVITPDIFVVSPSVGVLSIIVDTMSISRNSELEELREKMEIVDNYVYTTLLKNRELKANARSLKIDVQTIGYCPNLNASDIENVFFAKKSIVDYLDSQKSDDKCYAKEIIECVVSSLEASGAIIKPKERIIDEKTAKNTKANILKNIETKIARFDDEQRYSALSLLEGPQRIRGLAGSGKTIILCLKAASLHMKYPDATILYTFYTKSLYDYIVQLITRFYMKLTDGQIPDFNKIQVLHAWGGNQVPGVYYVVCKDNGIMPLTYSDAADKRNPFSYICKRFINDTKNNAKKMYDYILLDEAQDFEPPFYQLCRSVVKNDHIVWCYDEVQNIFDVIIQDVKSTFANEYDGQGIDLKEYQSAHPQVPNDIVLHKSYRNVKKILMVAVTIGFGIYNERLVQSLENNSHWEDLGFKVVKGDCSKEEEVVIERLEDASPLLVDEGMIPDCIQLYPAKDFRSELEWIVEEIYKSIHEERLLPDDIAVICIDQKNSISYMSALEEMLAAKGIETYNVLDKNYVKGFSRENKVTLSSVFKAKGNEAAMVFVCGCDSFEKRKDERKMRNMVFTAFTRAKVWLRISGMGENSLTQLKKEMDLLKEHDFKLCFMNKPTHLLDKDWIQMDKMASREDEVRQSIQKEARRLNVSVEEYLRMTASIVTEQEKKLYE